MSHQGWRTVFDRHLVDGLTVDERIARLEGAMFGTDVDDALHVRLDDAEAEIDYLRAITVRRAPFYRRWFYWLLEAL